MLLMFFLNTFRVEQTLTLSGKLFHNTLFFFFILLFPKELLGTKITSSSCSIIMYTMIVHKVTMKYRWY